MWILLVEDDAFTRDFVKTGLEQHGHSVDVAVDGIEGEMLASSSTYDLMIVDWMMPRLDGCTLVERLREAQIDSPILMLTSMADVADRVTGLDAGADDYLTKPFSFEELMARLRALHRRQLAAQPAYSLCVGPLHVDTKKRVATVEGEALDLRAKEYALLELFVRQPNTVMTRTIIAERVWGTALGVTDDVINTTVSSLRRKLRAKLPAACKEVLGIRTIRGVGYCLEAPEGDIHNCD